MVKPQEEILLKALIRIGQDLASTVEIEELLERVLRASREVFRFENAIIRLLDDERGVLATAAAYGYDKSATSAEIRMGEGITGKVALSGKPILVNDVWGRPDYLHGITDARSELAVPLVSGDRIIGVFNVESPEPNAFDESDIEPLMTMASQAAVAIENARLCRSLRTVSDRYRHLHQFHRRVLDSSNLGVYTVDAEMRITSWNRTIEDMSGVSEEEAIGKKLFSLFPSLEKEKFAERMRSVLKSGRPERLRLTHRNLKGELRFQKRRLSPLKEDGRTIGVVVLVEDITEFRMIMEQLIRSEKLAEVGRLSTGIAHEINNPLAVIAYGAELLLREDLSDFQRELLDRISGEAERLKTLTDGLLSFSRGKEMVKRWTDLNEVAQDVARLLRYEAEKRSVRLETNCTELPLVEADPNKLKQVLINLILNALQALNKGGTVTLETSFREKGEAIISVKDTGPGIPDEVRERIFEPFFTTKKEGEGTGLGLYICQNIVVEHGGHLDVESRPGEGTTFHISLPLGKMTRPYPSQAQRAEKIGSNQPAKQTSC